MTGDQSDMQQRIRSVLPTRWFPDAAPVLDELVFALSWSWTWLYSLLAYVKAQTRLASAAGVWLDMIAFDYFGDAVARGATEDDESLRGRIAGEFNRERGTRAALVRAVKDVTGGAPAVFEPFNTQDTGCWGGAETEVTAFAYGEAGGWGSSALPFQLFVTVFRPPGLGLADAAGWGTPAGGYGAGSVEYAAASDIEGGLTDAAIYAAIADVLPVAAAAWTQITSLRQ